MSLPLIELSHGWAVVADCAVWAVGGTATGYLTHRVSIRHWGRDSWLTRPRAFEQRPGFYEERLRIKRWKAKLPEAGALFPDGFSKRHLQAASRLDDVAYYQRFVVETRRAEVTHWIVLAFGPWFYLWNPWWLATAMVAYGVIANLPCIAIQRYNRLRLRRVIDRAERSTRSEHHPGQP